MIIRIFPVILKEIIGETHAKVKAFMAGNGLLPGDHAGQQTCRPAG
jgi:hypothetical protein